MSSGRQLWEPFDRIRLPICARTAVMGYSEDYIGYIPTDRAFKNGGYEPRPGCWPHLAPGSETTICSRAIQLLGSF
jgi:hypothetical protein